MGHRVPRTVLITKVIEFDAGHRVPTHNGKCRNPHGHRYRLEATFAGEVPESGMLEDFSVLKKMLTTLVHDHYDHRFIVWDQDEPMRNALGLFDSDTQHRLDPYVIVSFVPTAENLAAAIAEGLEHHLAIKQDVSFRVHRVRLFETPTSWADFYPSPRSTHEPDHPHA